MAHEHMTHPIVVPIVGLLLLSAISWLYKYRHRRLHEELKALADAWQRDVEWYEKRTDADGGPIVARCLKENAKRLNEVLRRWP